MIRFIINNITIHATNLNELESLLENKLKSSTPSLITTFNLDFLRITNIDKQFRYICNNSLYNLPDGFGITSLIKIKYKKNIERITGNDLFPLLLKLAKKNGLRIAVIGGKENVSKIAKRKIKLLFNIDESSILSLSPPLNFETDNEQNRSVINTILKFSPDIVFAALGCPRQEKWLFNNMNKFGSKINVGIGATLDFFTEEKQRSPILLQKIGLEWLWRLISEPKRLFKRYIIQDLPFYFKLLLRLKKT